MMKNKPIPNTRVLLGAMLLLMSGNSHAGTQSIADYVPGAFYGAGDQVQNIGKIYQCKPWPYSGWCQQAVYAPGSSYYWTSAWTLIGDAPSGGTPNNTPTISGNPATTLEADGQYSFTPSASDADSSDSLSFSIQNKPAWASFNSATGALTGTASNGNATNIIISVSDGTATASLSAFSINVIAAQAPVITLNGNSNITLQVGDTFNDAGATANDNVDGNLTANIVVTGSVNTQVAGTYSLTYRATDTTGHTGTATRTIVVEEAAPTNQVPVISGSPVSTLEADGQYSFTPTASDADSGDSLSFSIQNKPAWASFNSATGALTGTASNGNATNIIISVSDGTATASLSAFSINVIAAQAPVITLNGNSNITLQVGDTFNDAGATANDNVDGNLTANIVVTGSVNTQLAGSYSLTYRVTDTTGHSGTATRTIVVEDITPPVTQIPKYIAGTVYGSGQQVQHFGKIYQCRPAPRSGWCQQAAYEPGQSAYWREAWILIGDVPNNSGYPNVTVYAVGTAYQSGDVVSNLGGLYRCKGYPVTDWCAKELYMPGDSDNWREAWEYLGADSVGVNSSNGQIAITLANKPESSISDPRITVNGVSYAVAWGGRTLLTTMSPGDYIVSAANSDSYLPQFTQADNSYFEATVNLTAGQITEVEIAYVAKNDFASAKINNVCNQCHNSHTLDSEERAEKFLFNETLAYLRSDISEMNGGQACSGRCPEVMADYLRDVVWEAYRTNIVNRLNNNGQVPDNKGKRLIRLLTRYEYLNTIKDVFGITLVENDFSIYVPGRHLLFPTIQDRTVTDTLLAEFINKGAIEIEKNIDPQFFTQCASDDIDCIVDAVGIHLFHRPLTATEKNTYVNLGENEGLPMALASMTLSPNFLYRTEMGDMSSGNEYQLTQHEIATAVAYGYTGHGPDEILLGIAEQGDLSSPAILEIQAKRLIKSNEGKAYLSKFFEPLVEVSDAKLKLKEGIVSASLINEMKTEFQLFLEEVIINEPAGLEQLYTPGYTYLNNTLANHYAIDASELSSTMSKVDTDVNHGGLLHLGIFHTSNSGPDTTHLIRRARVVRENLLCRNLGTPVGKIPETIVVPELASTREFWTAVNGPESGICWECHQYMNDVGFALDSFDIQGKYRTIETVQGIRSQEGLEAMFDILTDGYFLSDETGEISFTNLRDLSQIIGSSDKSAECMSTRYLQFVRGYKGELSDSRYLKDAYMNSGMTKDLMIKQVVLPSFINKQ